MAGRSTRTDRRTNVRVPLRTAVLEGGSTQTLLHVPMTKASKNLKNKLRVNWLVECDAARIRVDLL